MWVCVNCSEQNNAVGTSECMVCRAVAPTRSSPRVASRQKKTKTEESGPEKAALVAEVPGAVWRNDGTLLIYGVPATPEAKAAKKKVAAFDLDSTLVVPRSGAKFAQSRADWKWLDTRVPEKLHKLAAAGFELVVFSNQAGVEKKQTTQEEVRGRAENVAAALGVPMRWFLATAGDQYRKPSPVMWELYEALFSDSVVMAESFYCGDAAGRKKNWAAGKPRDFACSDRMFAANVGLPFVTPEELFFGEKPTDQWNWGSPDPRTLVAKYENAVAPKIVARVAADGAVELVVLVGSPASGKSSLAKGIFEKAGFVRANNDDLGSKAKSLKVAAAALAAGKSVVVDNTNPDSATRREWIALAQRHGAKHVRCLHIKTPREVADHLNLYREMSAGRKRIPDVAFHTFAKRLEVPTTDEGFHSVETVPFALRFETERQRKLFGMWQ